MLLVNLPGERKVILKTLVKCENVVKVNPDEIAKRTGASPNPIPNVSLCLTWTCVPIVGPCLREACVFLQPWVRPNTALGDHKKVNGRCYKRLAVSLSSGWELAFTSGFSTTQAVDRRDTRTSGQD